MRVFKFKPAALSAVAVLVLLGTSGLAPEPRVHSPISGDEFVRAMATQRTSLIDFYFSQHFDPNARAGQDRPIILAAILQQDWATVRRLLEAGACLDLADESRFTPLMAVAMNGKVEMIRAFVGGITDIHVADRSGRTALQYAIAAQKAEAVELLLRLTPNMGPRGSDLLAAALDTGNWEITRFVLDRLPPLPQWTDSARRTLRAALTANNRDQVRVLLKKHIVPPTPEGRSVPLLGYAIASHDTTLFNQLLECGADPNTVLPPKCDEDFLALLPQKMRNYFDGDKGVTALMLAAGLGQPDCLSALLAAGADKDRATGRYKMLALYLAAQTGQWRCTQLLLGSGPPPEQLRIEVTLASQHVALIKDGTPIFSSNCSTGRSGYSTRAGDYVITDKARSHRSTIYHVDMPYFMRLSCLDFGMHEGVVPNYPASHGCIRLPSETARRLFAEIPVGTLVTVK